MIRSVSENNIPLSGLIPKTGEQINEKIAEADHFIRNGIPDQSAAITDYAMLTREVHGK